MTAPYQLYDDLEPAVEAALRSSIKRWGVIYPIVVDQHGHVIDGHHRERIAKELGLRPKTEVRRVRSEDDARELARTLNEDRRHIPTDQRRQIVADLREEGHSLRAIGGALGVDHKTVHKDLKRAPVGDPSPTAERRPEQPPSDVDPETGEVHEKEAAPAPRIQPSPPPRVRGTDGKSYPSAKPDTDARLRMNFIRAHERFGKAMADMFDFAPDRVAAVLNDEDSDTDWHMIEESMRLTETLADWFRCTLKERPKPFTVVQGGRS